MKRKKGKGKNESQPGSSRGRAWGNAKQQRSLHSPPPPKMLSVCTGKLPRLPGNRRLSQSQLSIGVTWPDLAKWRRCWRRGWRALASELLPRSSRDPEDGGPCEGRLAWAPARAPWRPVLTGRGRGGRRLRRRGQQLGLLLLSQQ